LGEEKTSQHTMSMKAKTLQDKKSLFRKAATAQRTIDSQKR
jgi:hypothetical protein